MRESIISFAFLLAAFIAVLLEADSDANASQIAE